MPIESDFNWIESRNIKEDIVELKGEEIHRIFDKVRSIITHQFNNREIEGIKGFIFHGEVGTGKTALAKALAKNLSLPLLFVDGSTIARGLYGQSEEQVNAVFREASKRKSLVLIDDAESVFPDRDWIKGESWHVAQNNIFFHCLDNLDTSKTMIIMTTNKYNLLDKAVKDRLYPIEFPIPNLQTLLEITKLKCLEKGLQPNAIVKEIKKNSDKFKSVRDVEKLIIEIYVGNLMDSNPGRGR